MAETPDTLIAERRVDRELTDLMGERREPGLTVSKGAAEHLPAYNRAAMKITIRQIEGFLAVAETSNFSSAARRLNVAQPALSQAVKDLEAELRVRLFDRTTRRVVLTDAGREFRGAAGKVVEDLEIAVENARDLAILRRGRIRVAAPPLLAALILPQAIAEFRERHPGIAVELFDVGTRQIVDYVLSGRVECGLGTFLPGEDGIERITLTRDKLMLFCDCRSPFNAATTVKCSELAGQPLIAITRDSGIRLLVEVGFETSHIPMKPAYEVSLVTTALAMVEAGLGISVLPSYALVAARLYKLTGKVLVAPSISRDVVMIQASGRSPSPAVSAFTTVVRQHVQKLKIG